jgi:hypothetical protein
MAELRSNRAAMTKIDRSAYEKHPETEDEFWSDAEAWGEE